MALSRERLRYYEDFALGDESQVGPCVIGRATLTELCALSQLLPLDRPPPAVVPDLLLHSYAAGHVGARLGYSAVVCVRSADYRPLQALAPEQPFWIWTRVEALEPVDRSRGIVEILRRITRRECVVSEARLNALLLRRPSKGADR